jgi:hypothetical protein
MEIIDVVRKLTGPIEPVGEHHTDTARAPNLDQTIELVDTLLRDLADVSKNADRHEDSMKQAGKKAKSYIGMIYADLDEMFGED